MSRESFLQTVNDLAESVYEFHHRFNLLPIGDNASYEEIREVLKHRVFLAIEEIGELASAVNKDKYDNMLEEAADDLYISLGTIFSLGIFGENACHDVKVKNDKKTLSKYRQSNSGKIVGVNLATEEK